MITLSIQPVSIIDHEGRQWIDIQGESPRIVHGRLRAILMPDQTLLDEAPLALDSGFFHQRVFMRAPSKYIKHVRWEFIDTSENLLWHGENTWSKPRQWTIHVIISSHTDIGLHNSQYIQRFNASRFIDMAAELCDTTSTSPEDVRYRYCMEGNWFWENYGADRGKEAARRIVRDYIDKGLMGVFAGHSGNTFQTFGQEELQRVTSIRDKLSSEWGIYCSTLAMIDMNGMPWAMVAPFAKAGYRNILFAPNQWNPLPSTIWLCDGDVGGFEWNPEASGGGSRIDFRLGSALPRIFWWEAPDGQSRLLVSSGGNYSQSGWLFGLENQKNSVQHILTRISCALAKNLPKLESSVPYDTWILPNYRDDQVPEDTLVNQLDVWNKSYAWPHFKTVGNPDAPFEDLRSRWGNQIPVMRGDITGGWWQLAASVADVLSRKFEADRRLPEAETLCRLAAIKSAEFIYPTKSFERAWDALICNDEHSYGCSGYQGRRVFETWLQHNAWIDRALDTAQQHAENALSILSKDGCSDKSSNDLFIFNATSHHRTEIAILPSGDTALIKDLPPLSGRHVPRTEFKPTFSTDAILNSPPTLDSRHFLVRFASDGGIASIFDKALNRELLNTTSPWAAGTLVYTQDNHKSFSTPQQASFMVVHDLFGWRVTVQSEWSETGASVCQKYFFPDYAKRIEFDHTLVHVRDMVNANRYHRFLYAAFPFEVPQARRLIYANGCTMEYAKDVTGHGTDTYMAARDWACAENDSWGIALAMRDSQLIEFDHIHPDKTDFGDAGSGSEIYAYLANDWLQMHVAGGSHLHFRFRFAIMPYKGSHHDANITAETECFNSPLYVYDTQKHNEAKELDTAFDTKYTGLVDAPRAIHGEKDGQLYLLWGRSLLPNLNHYEVHRSTDAGFTPSAATLVATVEPSIYCIEHHEELGLGIHERYYYRICAVDDNGTQGPFSNEFSAWTREPPQSPK
ncbi:MAG: hypothetical protein J6X55_11430 [Victivallales bacterium]|nr:hypothetical protein [Victivallales bacterium]